MPASTFSVVEGGAAVLTYVVSFQANKASASLSQGLLAPCYVWYSGAGVRGVVMITVDTAWSVPAGLRGSGYQRCCSRQSCLIPPSVAATSVGECALSCLNAFMGINGGGPLGTVISGIVGSVTGTLEAFLSCTAGNEM